MEFESQISDWEDLPHLSQIAHLLFEKNKVKRSIASNVFRIEALIIFLEK